MAKDHRKKKAEEDPVDQPVLNSSPLPRRSSWGANSTISWNPQVVAWRVGEMRSVNPRDPGRRRSSKEATNIDIYQWKDAVSTVRSIWAVCLLMLLSTSGLAFSEQSVTFRFDPPDGTTFFETQRITKKMSITGGDEAMPSPQIDQGQLRYRVQKTAEGYAVVTSPMVPDKKFSDDVASAIADITRNMIITYYLDEDGQLIRVGDVEESLNKVLEMLPPEFMELMRLMMPQSIEEQMAYQWKMRSVLGMHVGQTMKLDTDYDLAGRMPTPTGPGMQLEGALRVTATQACPGQNCVIVSYRYESDDQSLGQQLTDAIQQALVWMVQLAPPEEAEELIPQLPTMVVKDTKVVEKGSRRLDSATGLIYGENIERDILATVVFQDQDQRRFRLTEIHDHTYDYQ